MSTMRACLTIILFCYSLNLSAAMEVVYLRAPALFQTPDKERVVISRGDRLAIGSRIQVGEGGLVVLRADNGSSAKLDEGAAFEITHFSIGQDDTQNERNKGLFTLLRGAAFFYFPQNSEGQEDSDYRVRTRSASFGVRGTQFFVAHGRENPRGDDIWMCVDQGIVEVLTREQHSGVKVRSGEGVRLAAGLDISTPRPLPWTRQLNWNMDPDQGDLDNPISIEQAYASPLEMDID